MLASIFILDEGTVPIPEGCKVLVRMGFHLSPDLDEARAETAKMVEMTAPGKRVIAEAYVPIIPEFILQAADLLMATMEDEMGVDFEVKFDLGEGWFLEEIDSSPFNTVPPPAADWKQQYIDFATSFTEKLTAKVQTSDNPFEVIRYLDDLFKEMAFSHQPLDPAQLAHEILEATKDNEERRKAQQWMDLGL